jgi:hypothetical protein
MGALYGMYTLTVNELEAALKTSVCGRTKLYSEQHLNGVKGPEQLLPGSRQRRSRLN